MEAEYLTLIDGAIGRCKEEVKAVLESGDLSLYRYQKAHTEEAGTFDANYKARARLVQGLRFSPELSLEPLMPMLRELFLEELKDRESNSFQGFGPPLEILTDLLNSCQQAEDQALFERAKNANFDCACGYEVGPCGDFVYARDLKDYDLLDCIYLAQDLYEEETASALTDLWIHEQLVWEKANLQTRIHLEGNRGNLLGKLEALEGLLAILRMEESDWDFCSEAKRCLEVQLLLARYDQAWQTLEEMIPRLESCQKNWSGCGLGRSIIECCMSLILAGEDTERAEAIWSWVYPYLIETKTNLHWNLYRKAAEAAWKMKDYPLSRELTHNLQAEQEKAKQFS